MGHVLFRDNSSQHLSRKLYGLSDSYPNCVMCLVIVQFQRTWTQDLRMQIGRGSGSQEAVELGADYRYVMCPVNTLRRVMDVKGPLRACAFQSRASMVGTPRRLHWRVVGELKDVVEDASTVADSKFSGCCTLIVVFWQALQVHRWSSLWPKYVHYLDVAACLLCVKLVLRAQHVACLWGAGNSCGGVFRLFCKTCNISHCYINQAHAYVPART